MDPRFFRQYLDILSERTVINPETGEIQPTLAQTITGPAATQNQMDQAEERYLEELQRAGYDIITEKKIRQRLDPKCWKGKHKEGTKIKGGVRVNNCVPNK